MDLNWYIQQKAAADFIGKFPEINPIILQLLYNRGFDNQIKIDEFLYPDYSADQNPPEKFAQMNIALKRIDQAIDKQEKIVIHGDYDADGVCATCLMQEVLAAVGLKNISVYIPNRETEGYGLNKNTVSQFIKEKINLIITVDCGIANAPEIEYAKKHGLDTIITDHHHEPLIMPVSAVAIIDPALENEPYPFKNLAGVGVAFKFAQALIKKYQLGEGFEKWLLDLVAISTITDCMPLLSENHTLVKYGLIVLNKTKRIGLIELFKKIGNNFKMIDEEVVGFRIGPRLNAAGRMDHANTAYQLLKTNNQKEAEELSKQLNNSNTARQKITETIVEEVKNQIKDQLDNSVFFAYQEKWPVGILGLVAGKIADEYTKPTFIITKNRNALVGSGRSIAALNIIETVQECEKFLDRYGGHAQACGFTLKKEATLEEFVKKFQKIAEQKLKGADLRKKIKIECEIKLAAIGWPLIAELEKFSPFGEGNPKPKFLLKKVKIIDQQTVGKNNKHLRLVVSQDQHVKKSIGFNFGKWLDKIKLGDYLDMIVELGTNEWNGTKEIQMKIIDLKLCPN